MSALSRAKNEQLEWWHLIKSNQKSVWSFLLWNLFETWIQLFPWDELGLYKIYMNLLYWNNQASSMMLLIQGSRSIPSKLLRRMPSSWTTFPGLHHGMSPMFPVLCAPSPEGAMASNLGFGWVGWGTHDQPKHARTIFETWNSCLWHLRIPKC